MPYTIPIGPYHPALEEPYKVSVTCGGERVQDVRVEVGFSFRGIELLAQRRNWVQAVTLIERVCGICSNVHALTFCNAAEAIAGIEVPPRARYIRTIMYELERMHSHLLWAGAAAECIGFHTLYMETFALRERVMDLLEAISGNRVQYGMNRIGGVNRDIAEPERVATEAEAIGATIESDLAPPFLRDKSVANRTAGVGRLTRDQAIEWGVVGPVARASGLAVDLRRDHPHGAYPDLDFRIVTQDDGDVRARVVVRTLELLESVRIIREAVRRMPDGPIRAFEGVPRIPPGETTARAEAPRGEVFYYVASDGGDAPARVKIRTPSFVNIPAIEAMAVGQQLADMPLIQASVDPCLSCTDR